MTIIEILNWIGFGVATIMIATLSSTDRVRKNLNFLIDLLAVLCIGLLAHATTKYFYQTWPQPYIIADFIIFLIGPLVYLFIRNYLYGKHRVSMISLHYMPAYAYLMFNIIAVLRPTNEVIQLFEPDHVMATTVMPTIYFLANIQLIIYCVCSYNLLKRADSLNKALFINDKLKLPMMLILFLTGLFTFCLTDFLPYLNIPDPFPSISENIIWLIIVGTILGLNVFIMRYPQLSILMKDSNKNTNMKLPENYNEISAQLESLMRNKKPFLNKELTLGHVAEQLKLTKTTLSLILNGHLELNFYDYINEKRIDAFVDFVKSNTYPNLTYFGIAQEAGFKSKATFYKAFKSKHNNTPKEYFG